MVVSGTHTPAEMADFSKFNELANSHPHKDPENYTEPASVNLAQEDCQSDAVAPTEVEDHAATGEVEIELESEVAAQPLATSEVFEAPVADEHAPEEVQAQVSEVSEAEIPVVDEHAAVEEAETSTAEEHAIEANEAPAIEEHAISQETVAPVTVNLDIRDESEALVAEEPSTLEEVEILTPEDDAIILEEDKIPSAEEHAALDETAAPATEEQIVSDNSEAPVIENPDNRDESETPATEEHTMLDEVEILTREDHTDLEEDNKNPSIEEHVPIDGIEAPATEEHTIELNEVPATEDHAVPEETEVPATEEHATITEAEIPAAEVHVASDEKRVPAAEEQVISEKIEEIEAPAAKDHATNPVEAEEAVIEDGFVLEEPIEILMSTSADHTETKPALKALVDSEAAQKTLPHESELEWVSVAEVQPVEAVTELGNDMTAIDDYTEANAADDAEPLSWSVDAQILSTRELFAETTTTSKMASPEPTAPRQQSDSTAADVFSAHGEALTNFERPQERSRSSSPDDAYAHVENPRDKMTDEHRYQDTAASCPPPSTGAEPDGQNGSWVLSR